MEDIAPALLEELQQAFAEKLDASDGIRRLLKAIRDGTGTYIEAGDYAWEVGDALADVFGERLSSAVLPDGRMYYNIADRVIRPLLEQDHALVADAARTVQQHLNEKAKIGLKAQAAPLNVDRIDGILDRVSAAESFDDVSWLLGDPVRTFSQSIVDDTLKANMDFQGKAGLSPKIHRKATGKCCEWCQALAGVYRYPDTPDDVYRRHNNCRCTVEYDGGDAKNFQNVWTKKWTTAEERDRIEARKRVGNTSLPAKLAEHPAMLASYTPERLKQAFEQEGLETKPLKRGALKDVPFDEGGGFKVNFEDGGLLQYHPASKSHHGGAYYKISTGKGGTKRYELDGTEKQDKKQS